MSDNDKTTLRIQFLRQRTQNFSVYVMEKETLAHSLTSDVENKSRTWRPLLQEKKDGRGQST